MHKQETNAQISLLQSTEFIKYTFLENTIYNF